MSLPFSLILFISSLIVRPPSLLLISFIFSFISSGTSALSIPFIEFSNLCLSINNSIASTLWSSVKFWPKSPVIELSSPTTWVLFESDPGFLPLPLRILNFGNEAWAVLTSPKINSFSRFSSGVKVTSSLIAVSILLKTFSTWFALNFPAKIEAVFLNSVEVCFATPPAKGINKPKAAPIPAAFNISSKL